MASFFKTLSDDMEKVAQVFEEGYQIMTGAATRMGEAPDATGASNLDDVLEDGNEDNINLEDIEEYGSPLMGMADSVMSDIMSHQVRRRRSSCVDDYYDIKRRSVKCGDSALFIPNSTAFTSSIIIPNR
jgi:hypothetical protein